jgi:AcrR family transcriptional regulator
VSADRRDAPPFRRAVPPKARAGRDTGGRFADVVDAAAELFSSQGYAATSIQDIADAVGLLGGSLYHYIDTKEDLLYAVILEVHEHTAALGYEALGLDDDAVAKLRLIIQRHLHGAGANLAKLRVFYRESRSLSPKRLAEIVADRDSYEHSLRKVIQCGQDEGAFASHLDPVLTSISILAILNSVQQWYRPDSPRTIDEVATAFTDLILRSVSVSP